LTGADFDIGRLLGTLWRRKLLILCLALIVPAAALASSLLAHQKYTATATILFRSASVPPQLQTPWLPPELTDLDPARQEATDVALANLSAVAENTVNQLGRPIGDVSVTGNASTDVLSVSATETSPKFAADVANAYAKAYVLFRSQRYVALIAAALTAAKGEYAAIPKAQRHGSAAAQLSSTIVGLTALARLQDPAAAVVQAATTPIAPDSRRVVRNVGLGLGAGILLGLALAVLLDLLSNSSRDAKVAGRSLRGWAAPIGEQHVRSAGDRVEQDLAAPRDLVTDSGDLRSAGHATVTREHRVT
jgi:uncharacterized protein involved in exopolysaccharide biosynthesis